MNGYAKLGSIKRKIQQAPPERQAKTSCFS